MIESRLRVKNFCWPGDSRPSTEAEGVMPAEGDLGGLRGQFAFAAAEPDGIVRLVRDRLGLNKLFLAIHESGKVRVANYLIELVRLGVPFQAIYSVPAGHSLEVNPGRRTLSLSRYFAVEAAPRTPGATLDSVARNIRRRLAFWFARLSERLGSRKVSVCLSGGADSAVIAAFAREYFPDVTAYTYGFVDAGGTHGEDVVHAERLARFLRVPFRFVPASSRDVFGALENALCYGQDWRDFNVHCAIVNELLARAVRSDAGGGSAGTRPLVLTGDLANEFLADYAPVSYDGREYYRLPRIGPAELRLALIRGLDAGDREIGIFNHHDIDVIQPYGLLLDEYLGVPAGFLAGARCKQTLAREVAGDRLPGFVFDRVKVRAQIGSATGPGGILPALLARGCDSGWLRQAFCRLLSIADQAFLTKLVRTGRYRSLAEFPQGQWRINGYLAG